MVALAAGDAEGDAIDRALDFLAEKALADVQAAPTNKKGPYTGRIVSGLVAVGEDPSAFASTDFVALLESFYNPATGSYGGDNIYADLLAMLGVLAAERLLPEFAVTRVKLNQCRDGGWSWQTGCPGKPDTDTTSLAISVLAATVGAEAPEVRRGRQWLIDTQRTTKCWSLDSGSPPNANSCGLAISAILALGEDPRAAPWGDEQASPPSALRRFQTNSGGFRFVETQTKPNDYATVQAVPGMAGWSYPVAPLSEDGESGDEDEDEDEDEGGDEGTEPEEPRRSTASTSGPAGSDPQTRSISGEDGRPSDQRSTESGPRPSLWQTTKAPTTTSSSIVPRLNARRAEGEDGRSTMGATRSRDGDGGTPLRATIKGDEGAGVGTLVTGMATGSVASAATGVGWWWRWGLRARR